MTARNKDLKTGDRDLDPIDVMRTMLKHDADLIATVKAAILTDPEFLASVRDGMLNDVAFLQFIGEQAARAIAPSTEADEAAAKAEAAARADRETAHVEAEKKAKAAAKARAKLQENAKAMHAALMSGEAHGDIDLDAVDHAALLVSDGDTFCIDFVLSVEPSDLSLTDQGNVVLKHAPIAIGVGIADPFTVKAFVLRLKVGDADLALPCAMSQPLTVGGGQDAKIGENSLLFRRRHEATGAAADDEAATA